MGEHVLIKSRWGPRGHVKPTPLFFTPPGNTWGFLEIGPYTSHIKSALCTHLSIGVIIIIIIITRN